MTGSLNALLAATAFFVLGHFLLSSRPIRRVIADTLGAQGFRLLYSAAVLAAFVWMLQAYRAAPTMVLWTPPPAFAWVPLLLMPLAIFLVLAGVTTTSVTLVGGEARLDDPGTHDLAPGIMRVTRHPFLWGTALWAVSHLAVNGNAADLVLMGGILVLSLGGMWHIDQRREAALGAAWGPVKLTTSALPFGALMSGRTTMDWAGIGWWRPVIALLLYAILLHLHPLVIGVPAVPA